MEQIQEDEKLASGNIPSDSEEIEEKAGLFHSSNKFTTDKFGGQKNSKAPKIDTEEVLKAA